MNDYFLADDLSGALDAASGFFHAGRRVTVALGRGMEARETNGSVVGITTETRNATEEAAARAVAEAMARARDAGGRLLYKKIDSTLRGPIVAELRAVMAAMPEARVLFTPANPAAGRTVRGGTLLVRGVAVTETEFARDPVWPVRESSLRQLLADLPQERLVIADAETEGDLVAAVRRMQAEAGDWVGVGSGALARAVAAVKRQNGGLRTEEESQGKAEDRARAARIAALRSGVVEKRSAVLMLCGSAHPANRTQAEQLRADRGVAVCDFRMDNAAVAAQEMVAVLRRGGGVSVVTEPTRVESAALLRTISNVAAQAIVGASVRRMFITGGETAFAVCSALGVKALEFRREIEPGVCLASATLRGSEALIAIKPGGFGDAETWVRVWDELNA